jgi:hypothetical protein
MESRLKDEGRFLLSIGVAASDLTEEKETLLITIT